MSTATASGSVSGTAVYWLAGGTFAWWTGSSDEGSVTTDTPSGGGGTNTNMGYFWGAGAQGAGGIGVYGYNGSFYIQERYINSSPPYNFGESFVYVAYDKDNKIVGISAALDPTWAHHGPHEIVPKFWKMRGKVRVPYTYARTVEGILLPVARKDPKMRIALLKKELIPEITEQEITIDYKDADMETHPHPFGSKSVARVVLMHPDGPLAQEIAEWLRDGDAQEIVKMIEDGDLLIQGDGIIHPHAPSSIQVVKAKLR